mmetsp:Transcript_31557/g.45976  ORF Transcript_31557/g.45976 Transcript_31557/m.45976 type:complete len:269 (-) Transcript_31557:1853-2659(-)
MMNATRTTRAALLRYKPQCRTFSEKTQTESSQRLAAHRAKEADRQARKAELLRDLQTLQDKTRQVTNRERSWSEAIRATLKVAKPQLINIFATFACVVISAQMLVLKKEHQALLGEVDCLTSERDDLKRRVNTICSDGFVDGLSQKCGDAVNNNEEGTSSQRSSGGWFGFGGQKRRQNNDSIDENDSISVEIEIASVIRREIKHVFRGVQLENVENNEASIQSMQEAEDEAKMIQELIQNSTGDQGVEKGEVVSVEEGKVVRRKQFVM